MPLVRVSVHESTRPEERRAIAETIYEAMRRTIGIPEGDKFIEVTPRGPDVLFADAGYMGMQRTDRYILVQVFLSRGRTLEQKQALYAQIAEGLKSAVGVSTDDVMTVLTENAPVDWSFGKGVAQYALNPPSWVKQAEKE